MALSFEENIMLAIIMLSLNIICCLAMIAFCTHNIINKDLTKYGEDFFIVSIIVAVAMLMGSAFTIGSIT